MYNFCIIEREYLFLCNSIHLELGTKRHGHDFETYSQNKQSFQ